MSDSALKSGRACSHVLKMTLCRNPQSTVRVRQRCASNLQKPECAFSCFRSDGKESKPLEEPVFVHGVSVDRAIVPAVCEKMLAQVDRKNGIPPRRVVEADQHWNVAKLSQRRQLK